MNNLGKYWKPTKSDQTIRQPTKKLKAKINKKNKQPFPSYNEEWKKHWKDL